MASSSYASCLSRNCVYDVFPSFSGEDVRKRFLSHFLEELDRKLITAFKDNEIERSRSLDPELKKAIKDSRIAVVIFSEKYPSSTWCLNELLEIVKCQEELGQLVIPIFYDLEPSHVRKQTGKFGEVFDKTCLSKTQEDGTVDGWRKALTDVANILGYHSKNWNNEATMIQEIANDIVSKLTVTNSESQNDFVGMEDHISKMSSLLSLESKDVRKVGIWGPSGIGKTTVARTLFSRLSGQFQGSIFIDRSFISKSREYYLGANPDDYNMKLSLQEVFLSKLLGKKKINIDDLDKVGERLMHRRVLVIVDDLDDQMVLDTLVGRNHLFGPGSRIILVTKDKHLLMGHGLTGRCIYEMVIPSHELALEMFCRSAFGQKFPPDGFMKLASEVVMLVGSLPLGLNILGSSFRGRDKKYWLDMVPSLRKGLDGKLEKALRVSYDGLDRKEHKAIFRHIACFFNHVEIKKIKWILADSYLNVNICLKILVDKSLIRVTPSWDTDMVEMHCLVQEMGKEIVRTQSDEPGEREFLMDSKDVCSVLEDNIGTNKVLGISLDIEETNELQIHKEAFKRMRNLRFLEIYTNKWWDTKKQVGWHLQEGLEYLPPKLRLLRWDRYPLRCLPFDFRPENLVELQMPGSKLEKLWEGIHSLTGLREIDLHSSKNLREIPDLSMATNLETLYLSGCSRLTDLPSSIQYLNKLEKLNMSHCINVETFPPGINLQSLYKLNLYGCSKMRIFPDISTNIEELSLSGTGIEEVPWWIKKFSKLTLLDMMGCDNLQCVSLHFLELEHLMVNFSECRRLTKASLNDRLRVLDEASSSTPDNFIISYFNFVKRDLFEDDMKFTFMILSGEEVPSYFTHRTTENYLTNIPLLCSTHSQTCFKFMACAAVDCVVSLDFEIEVSCRFKDALGNHTYKSYVRFDDYWKGTHLVIFECFLLLDESNTSVVELNYKHMDVHLCIKAWEWLNTSLTPKVIGWGIRLFEDYSSLEHVSTALVSLDNETNEPGDYSEESGDDSEESGDDGEESGDDSEESERSLKRMRFT